MNITHQEQNRFYKKQSILGKCIVWNGKPDVNGHGRMLIGSTGVLVHKIAFFLKHGREPESYLIHTCDNRLCVNPDHIVEGKNEGRPVKVSAQKIIELKNAGLTASQIAEKLNCSVSLVRKRLK